MWQKHIRSARQTFIFSARFARSLFDYRDVHVVFNVVLLGQKRLLDLRGGTLPRKRLFWTYTWMWRLISLTSRTLSPAKACTFLTIRGSILCDSSATCERKDNFNKYGIQSSGKMHWWLIPNHVFGSDTNITYLPWKMICVVAISWKFNVDSPLPSRLSSCKLFFLLVFFFFKVVFSLHSASSFSFPWRDGHVPRHAGSHILFSQRWLMDIRQIVSWYFQPQDLRSKLCVF